MTVRPGDPSAAPEISPETPVVFVLLGASNLARGCFAVARHIRKCLPARRTEVLIAAGPGRAYATPGGLWNVVYPPIQGSEILDTAQSKSEAGYKVIALVTDIGNDIMYGVAAEKVVATIQQVFTRLGSMNATTFYTLLPSVFEEGVHPIRFHVLRTLLFPFSRVSYEEALAGIIAVNRFLREADGRQGHLIPEMDRYLGCDDIHYGWLKAGQAWSHAARVMLEALGVKASREISFLEMLQSYGNAFRQLVGVDMLKFKKQKPDYF